MVPGQAKGKARIEVLPVPIPGKGSRLMDQRPDHMPVVDLMMRPPNQPWHSLDEGVVIIDLKRVLLEAYPHDVVHQARRHRVEVMHDIDRAVTADPHWHLPILG